MGLDIRVSPPFRRLFSSIATKEASEGNQLEIDFRGAHSSKPATSGAASLGLVQASSKIYRRASPPSVCPRFSRPRFSPIQELYRRGCRQLELQTVMGDAAEKYGKAVELADTIVRRVGKVLSAALEQIGNPHLVKAVFDKPRIKLFPGVARKAQERGWSPDEAIEKCGDFVGFRVVCNNLQDVYRAADLFERALGKSGLAPERQDYIAKPKETGYRAIHISCPVEVGFAKDKMTLWCEVQIRTRLQDGWGNLSREDLYRRNVPDRLLKRMRELADTLAHADVVAEGIRTEVSKPRRGEKPEPGAPLTAPAIAFIFHRAFSADPPDYLVESTIQQIGKRSIRADALDALMQNATLHEELKTAYEEHTKWAPWPELMFGWVLQAQLGGKKSAIALAHKDGKEDWDEIEVQARSEMSHVVPETWDALEEELENGDADLYTLMDYFGAKESCVCGEPVYQFETLICAIENHYTLKGEKVDQASELIQKALSRGEFEDADGYGLCSYCQYVMNKD
jgi:ppGpp synthetase/RelA/SpoT-type nucleotidyltranferase